MSALDGFMDDLKLSRFHYVTILLCTLIALFDGYDGSAAAFAGPALLADLKFDPKTLGAVFSASLVGMVIGAGLFGLLADRFGRRPAIIVSTALFGVFTLMTGFADHFASLMVYRLVTGLGLGGALSNAVAVSAEFAPKRHRATIVSIVYSAFPMGSVLGGYLAVWLLKDFGWRSIFLLGAAATVPLLVAVLWIFPESIRFLCARGAPTAKIHAALQRLEIPTTIDLRPEVAVSAPLMTLFAHGMWSRTLLLWLAFFINQMVVYFLFMWMPIVLKTWGLGAQTGIIASATQSLGGVFGAFVLARIIDRHGASAVLTPAYIAAMLLVAAVGSVASSGTVVLVAVMGLCGFMLNGSNVNLASVGADLYPTSARSTGVGWAMGIGKGGGIVGSTIGGVLLDTGISLPILYALASVPLLLAALSLWALGRRPLLPTYNSGLNAAFPVSDP